MSDASRRAPMARRLQLADYRTYPALDLRIAGRMVAFSGENGAGKTNLLEALSLFTPGRGFRRADLADSARIGGAGGWAVSLDLAPADALSADDVVRLGAGLPASPDSGRQFRIDGAPVSSARAFADYLRVVWLTPAMDGLFMASAGERRRFLDRLVLAVESDHGARVNALEKALRNRNRLLEEGQRHAAWLDATERELAELGIAVSAARHETVARLAALIEETRDDSSPFPHAGIALEGEIEALVASLPVPEAEERFRDRLRQNRSRDAAAGRTLVGPHLCDLAVRHGPKGVEARLCSTGEQKALLVGLVLAHARLVAAMSGFAPLVLLDEVAAHFDPRRRQALFEALDRLGGQVWMTGADPAAFDDLPQGAQRFTVTPGRVEPV